MSGVLGDVAQHVPGVVAGLRGRRHAEPLVAPGSPEVLGSPVPAFDRVGRAHFARVAAQLAHQRRVHAAARMQVLRLAVTVLADGEHGVGPVRIDDALDLGLHHVERLVPADALELRFAAVGGVDLRGVTARLPVDALQRMPDAVLGVHAVLVGQREVVRSRLVAGREHLVAYLDLPQGGLELLLGVRVQVVDRADAHDLAVLRIDGRQVAARAAARDALQRGCLPSPFSLLPFAGMRAPKGSSASILGRRGAAGNPQVAPLPRADRVRILCGRRASGPAVGRKWTIGPWRGRACPARRRPKKVSAYSTSPMWTAYTAACTRFSR